MSTMTFNLYALAAPRSRDEWLSLATEALAEMKRVNDHLDEMFAELECAEAA
jgi:hypothetical protein